MGVSCVLVWREARGVGTQRAVEAAIVAGMEDLKGGLKQRWNASVLLMKSLQEAKTGALEDLLVVALPEGRARNPHLVLRAIERNEGRRARRVMEAGMAVAPLLQQAGTHAPRARLMVDGQQWVAGDFTVRLGAVTSNSEYRGTLVQVHYRPTSSTAAEELPREFAGVLAELTATTTGQLQPVDGALEGWALPPAFGDQHVAALFSCAVARLLGWPD